MRTTIADEGQVENAIAIEKHAWFPVTSQLLLSHFVCPIFNEG